MHRSNFKVNLIAPQSVKRIVQNVLFPYALQFSALAVFALLIIVGLKTGGPESYGANLTPFLRKTNLTTLVVWGLWWPALIVVTIVFGRIWCLVCPMELVSNIANRASRLLGFQGVVLPAWLRKGFLVLVAYLALQLLVAGFQVHRTPLYTAYVLVGLLVLALLAGFLFREPRAFCNSFCPAALLLDTYGSLSPFSLEKARDDVCHGCITKDCIKSSNRHKIDARSCPSYLRPFDLRFHDPCVLCLQCVKVCPHANIGFGYLRSQARRQIPERAPLATVAFIFVACGFVSHELFAETPAMDKIFHFVPAWLSTQLDRPELFPWLEAVWFLAVLPAAVMSIVWLAAVCSKSTYAMSELLSRIGFSLVPVLAAGHAIKAMLKLNAWSAFLPGAMLEPDGMSAARNIVAGATQSAPSIMPAYLISVLATIILALSALFAMRVAGGRFHGPLRAPAFMGITALAMLDSIVILDLLSR
ncbi:MAG: 4Fe-4S binding protein [Ignavibacteria bacterium]|nr:4Fe-4S binding protein [Ignavibacteria bacterium]